MKGNESDYIAIEECIEGCALKAFMPSLTGRTGYLHKKFIPRILHGQKVIQVNPDIFDKLRENMEDVNDITLR